MFHATVVATELGRYFWNNCLEGEVIPRKVLRDHLIEVFPDLAGPQTGSEHQHERRGRTSSSCASNGTMASRYLMGKLRLFEKYGIVQRDGDTVVFKSREKLLAVVGDSIIETKEQRRRVRHRVDDVSAEEQHAHGGPETGPSSVD